MVLPLFLVPFSWRVCHFYCSLCFPWRRCVPDFRGQRWAFLRRNCRYGAGSRMSNMSTYLVYSSPIVEFRYIAHESRRFCGAISDEAEFRTYREVVFVANTESGFLSPCVGLDCYVARFFCFCQCVFSSIRIFWIVDVVSFCAPLLFLFLCLLCCFF